MSEQILPYLQIKKMNELLKNIPIKILSSELTTKDLAKSIGINTSVAGNLVTTLKSLNLINGKGKLTITENGKKYIQYLKRDSIEEAKEILNGEVKDLDFFQLIESRLNQTGKLTSMDIGNYIAINYDKIWEILIPLKPMDLLLLPYSTF